MRGPGELEGHSVHSVPVGTQIVLVEYRREDSRGIDTSGERDGGQREASDEAGDTEEAEDRDKYVAKRQRQAEESTYDNRGG